MYPFRRRSLFPKEIQTFGFDSDCRRDIERISFDCHTIHNAKITIYRQTKEGMHTKRHVLLVPSPYPVQSFGCDSGQLYREK